MTDDNAELWADLEQIDVAQHAYFGLDQALRGHGIDLGSWHPASGFVPGEHEDIRVLLVKWGAELVASHRNDTPEQAREVLQKAREL